MSLSVALRHSFRNFELDVEFQASQGITALFGRSGSGKTSVINAVAGLLRPDHGRIILEGHDLMDSAKGMWLPPHKRGIGYVFQDSRLFPHLSVRQNLLYGRWFARRTDNIRFDHVVDLLGISPLLDRRPGALSGGEKQRVAIGRALLARPRLLLMDEPLAALDAQRKSEILPYLERLRDDTQIPILYVSHAMSEVARLASTLVIVQSGKVSRAGPLSDQMSDPAAAAMLGLQDIGAVVKARIASHEADGLSRLDTPLGVLWVAGIPASIGSMLRVRVHAQDVMLSLSPPKDISALNVLRATVTQVMSGQGPDVLVQLGVEGDRLLARVTHRSAANLGLVKGLPVYAIIKSVAVVRPS
ncbi:molybdenum ABC transporter ATP-binding protein [Paracoccus sp. JM45]|uniref:molybdenum ABC transporter ATP-binding protein n=1 Tax=Paracoccus sp. JM45 TaxID=2283626 RepID=UPI000E6BEDFA|nr:molybdenum ABC transporter ATP-binding protein [Paracoccus sp. JM45]RJE81100.1 molybdenum ABC transporter ATP-binding protein [Paracoccus sp. JM45]